MKMTAERIAEARRRCEAATKGPWDYGTPAQLRAAIKATGISGLVSNAVVVMAGLHAVATMTRAYRNAEADAAWMATAANDLPDALDDLEAALAVVRAARRACAPCDSPADWKPVGAGCSPTCEHYDLCAALAALGVT